MKLKKNMFTNIYDLKQTVRFSHEGLPWVWDTGKSKLVFMAIYVSESLCIWLSSCSNSN